MKLVLTPTVTTDLKIIAAIKAVRTVTYLGLIEAKDLVEQMRNSRQPIEIETSPRCLMTPEEMVRVLRDEGGFEVDGLATVSLHKDRAEKHLRDLAKELLDKGKYEAATNVTNLLGLLMKVDEE